LHNRKLGQITPDQFNLLRGRLLEPRIMERIGGAKRVLLSLAGGYNSLPWRVPGVNLVLYRLMTL
jgi:hypothetical protein